MIHLGKRVRWHDLLRPPGRSISPKYGEKTRKVALTFDDGPGPLTAELVDYLINQRCPATFFHPDLKLLDESRIKMEIQGGIDTLESLTGTRASLFRPPRGRRNRRVDAVAGELGQSIILWTLNAFDYKPGFASADQILDNVEPGDIILLHDTHRAICDVVRDAVPRLRDHSYELVTVSELLGERTPGRIYRGSNSRKVRVERWTRLQYLRARRISRLFLSS